MNGKAAEQHQSVGHRPRPRTHLAFLAPPAPAAPALRLGALPMPPSSRTDLPVASSAARANGLRSVGAAPLPAGAAAATAFCLGGASFSFAPLSRSSSASAAASCAAGAAGAAGARAAGGARGGADSRSSSGSASSCRACSQRHPVRRTVGEGNGRLDASGGGGGGRLEQPREAVGEGAELEVVCELECAWPRAGGDGA